MSYVCDLKGTSVFVGINIQGNGGCAMPVYAFYCHLPDAVYDLTLQSSFDIVYH